MKKLRCRSNPLPSRQVACTVSAAALMLGVSHAATIGLKFTVDYCGYGNYVNYVNAAAFGIPMNQWENLTAMGTGYHSCSGPLYFNLSETIDTTTSTGGLHPLPNGSLSLNWGGATENWSGFIGYDPTGPPQPITSGPPVPEAQVYAGFIRDGVNFGPGQGGTYGDNNQPGYNIDITGLRSLFTNTPYAVQLVASSDSMQYLTNAFIIDATLSTTQSVTYPNPQVYGNAGDTAWFRAIGGGLSTASGAFSTDHLKVIGNRAYHTAGPPAVNFASTISGVIITDKPVVTMSPRSLLASPADTIALSAYAVGVPPLSYQWRKNGQAIAGATTTFYSQNNTVLAYAGNYDLVVTNLYGAATSSVAVVTVDHITATPGNNVLIDSNPQNVEHDGLSFGATWLASDLTHTGVMSFSAAGSNQITVPVSTTFNSSTGTVMFWMRSSGLANPAGNPATLVDRRNGRNSGFVLVQNPDGTLQFQTDGGHNVFNSATSLSDNAWHHITLTYDQALNGSLFIYVDGILDASTSVANAWTWQPNQELELGFSNDPGHWQPYNGMLDDVRVYNRPLSDPEVLLAYTGALVDTTALLLRQNFDKPPGPGILLQWACPDAILQQAPAVNGPYTDLPGVASPYPRAIQGSEKFFRYHGHAPANVVSNPYLM